jgi:hypothetical protein
VTGTGQVQAQPDRAVVRLGVQTQADSAQTALADNNEQMQAVLDALTGAGIPAENIQTQSLRLQPIYEERPGSQGQGTPRELVGYRAANVVEVQSEDLAGLGQLLDAAVQAGGNTIQGIRFEVSDSTELADQAREAAMTEAERKASQLASLAGAELGEVLTINESSRTPRPVALEAGMARAEAVSVPVEAGSQTIEVDVQVTWRLR